MIVIIIVNINDDNTTDLGQYIGSMSEVRTQFCRPKTIV